MKRFFPAIAAVVAAWSVVVPLRAQAPPSGGVPAAPWNQPPTDDVDVGGASVADALRILAARSDASHALLRFSRPLTPFERGLLSHNGVQLGAVLDSQTFFAALDASVDPTAVLAAAPLIEARAIQTDWKLHPLIAAGDHPDHALVQPIDGPTRLAVYVSLHADEDAAASAASLSQAYGAVVRGLMTPIRAIVMEVPLPNIVALAADDAVQWVEPALPQWSEVNDSNRSRTQSSEVQASPYNLDGSGVRVLVFDGGRVDVSHRDFTGRIVTGDTDGVSGHATHVAGTIGGDGANSNGLYRGMAPRSFLVSYGFEWAGSGIFLYSNPGDLLADYTDAQSRFGAVLSNNSIGTNTCINGFPCSITGDYGITSQLIDSIVKGAAGARYRIVWANGNERSCGRCIQEGHTTPAGYHSTAPPACAKNAICVGALNSNDDTVTNFSSWGPCDDGRLKPEISAPGCQSNQDFGVTSCLPGGGYGALCGTSMAAPTVTGICALMMQDMRRLNPGGPDPQNATLKALLAHNAFDLFNPGPDYRTGYGSVRAKETIDFLRGGHYFEAAVDHNSAYTFSAWVSANDGELKITLAWDDEPAVPAPATALVNDLDLRVFDPNGVQYFPWTLDPSMPGEPAVRTDPDRLNNIEQVFVDTPLPGLWQIEVLGYNVPSGPQEFSVSVSPRISYDCNDNGTPDELEIENNPVLDCNENYRLDSCEPDCDGDGLIDACAISSGVSTDCNVNGLPDDCEAFADCNGNGVFDACDIATGLLEDCNGNFIPDICIELEADCDGNGVPDACDIAVGVWTDCNGNDVPDVCEFIDCNQNGAPDSCDIATGISADCDDDGIPDECQNVVFVHVRLDAPNDPGPNNPAISDPLEDGSEEHPFDTIQKGVNAGGCRIVVLLADGVYSGPGNVNVNFGGRSVTVRSENGPESCIIDCGGTSRGFVFQSREGSGAGLDGLTIRNANNSAGAAVLCAAEASPIIRNCVFSNNNSSLGGAAIHCAENSAPRILRCRISGSIGQRGSLYIAGATPLLEDCVIIGNATQAVYMIAGNLVARRCAISQNSTTRNAGAVYATTNASLRFENCIFAGNTTTRTGGVLNCSSNSSADFVQCTIRNNHANSGAAVLDSFLSTASFRGCILWNNTAGGNKQLVGSLSSISVDYSNVAGGLNAVLLDAGSSLAWGGSNIDSDPHFSGVDTAAYSLAPSSPCINASHPDPDAGATDFDGDARVIGGRADIGADEFATYAFGDLNCDGAINAMDISPFVQALVNRTAYAVDHPNCGAILADLNGDGIVSAGDIAAFVALIGGE